MKNRIPHKFIKIVGEMLTKTSHAQPGDVLHVFREENGDYLSYNVRNGVFARVFPAMLRNTDIFHVIQIL